MGDRTDMWIELKKTDREKHSKLLDEWDTPSLEEDCGDLVRLFYDEVNYGGVDFRSELNAAGLAYVGGHGTGDDYAGSYFAAIGGEEADSPTLHGSGLVIEIDDETGEPFLHSLEQVRTYLTAENAVRTYWGLEPRKLWRGFSEIEEE